MLSCKKQKVVQIFAKPGTGRLKERGLLVILPRISILWDVLIGKMDNVFPSRCV